MNKCLLTKTIGARFAVLLIPDIRKNIFPLTIAIRQEGCEVFYVPTVTWPLGM